MLGHIKRRDIANGDMLFGERLQLEQILRDTDKPEIERVRDIVECLHGRRPSIARAILMRDYAIDIAESFVGWLEREKSECTVEPTDEAKRAGVDEYVRNVGDIARIVDIAERFHILPFSRVYEIPYMDIFAIWKTDAESAKFERRLRKIREADARSKNKHH